MLVLVGFVGMIVGAYGTAPFIIWLSTLRAADHPVAMPVISLLALLVPIVPIALGVWAWRGRKVRKLVSIYSIVTGALGLGIAVMLGIVVTTITFVVVGPR